MYNCQLMIEAQPKCDENIRTHARATAYTHTHTSLPMPFFSVLRRINRHTKSDYICKTYKNMLKAARARKQHLLHLKWTHESHKIFYENLLPFPWLLYSYQGISQRNQTNQSGLAAFSVFIRKVDGAMYLASMFAITILPTNYSLISNNSIHSHSAGNCWLEQAFYAFHTTLYCKLCTYINGKHLAILLASDTMELGKNILTYMDTIALKPHLSKVNW